MGVVRDGPRGSGAASGRDPAELPAALGVPLSDEILERAYGAEGSRGSSTVKQAP